MRTRGLRAGWAGLALLWAGGPPWAWPQAPEPLSLGAQVRTCQRYWKGWDGEEPDYAAAAKWCRAAAQAGEPQAQAMLGSMYRQGQGVGQDFDQAYRLLKAAAERDVALAQYELGNMYSQGQGVARSHAEANRWYCAAAGQRLRRALDRCSQTRQSGLAAGRRGGVSFKQMSSGLGKFQGAALPELGERLREDEVGLGAGPQPNPAAGEITDDQVPRMLSAGAAKTVEPSVQLAPQPPAWPAAPAPAAKSGARTPRPRISLPWILLIAALACPFAGLVIYRLWRLASRRRIPGRIRALLRTRPEAHEEIAGWYQLYGELGGSAEAFSGPELVAIVASLDSCGRGLSTPGLSLARALDLAGRLASAGHKARVQDVLGEPVLAAAARAGRGEDVLGVLAQAGSLDDFVLQFSGPGRPAEFYSAYAGGLMRLGRVEQSFRMLTAKPLDEFNSEDQSLLLELHVRLGHFDQARLLLNQVTEAKPLAAAQDFYEELARQATMRGGALLAQDIRTLASGRPLSIAPLKPAALPAGRTLAGGKYELGEMVSSGGMGEVYEAYDSSLDRRVAVKKMLPELLKDPQMREQFMREAKTAAHLSHPYIVPIYECLESGGDLYLVFEFVRGETLAQVLARRSRLSLKECQGVFHYVCHAVDYAHRKRVLHRDLKPSNIMLDENGIARVMDFGIAIEVSGTLSATFVDRSGVTGTMRYMPPEQHYGKTSRASDVYALGVCLYEAATGYLPFNATRLPEIIEQKHKGEFKPPSFHVAGLPQEFDHLVRSALMPDPHQRVPSALAFYEILAKIPG